jgi:hypothetical protein
MWDNRPKKASGQFSAKSPDFKCKNQDCGGVIWPPKGQKAPQRPVQNAGQADRTKDIHWQVCFKLAAESVYNSSGWKAASWIDPPQPGTDPEQTPTAKIIWKRAAQLFGALEIRPNPTTAQKTQQQAPPPPQEPPPEYAEDDLPF